MPHTPAPWIRCGGATAKYMAIHSADGYIVFEMAHPERMEHGNPIKCPDNESQLANARLMAASPDLLEACQIMLDTFGDDMAPGTDAHWATMAAKRAIAKATVGDHHHATP